MLKRDSDKEKGFTLVELIIVMAILALLAALAVPRFGSVMSNAKDKADNANRSMIQEAIDLYIVQEGEAPSSLDDLKGNYLKEIPTKPNGEGEYSLDEFDDYI